MNDVLDLSKIENSKLEIEFRPFDLTQLMKSIAADAQLHAGLKASRLLGGCLLTTVQEVHYSMAVSPEVPTHVIGDITRIHQVS